MGTLAFKQLPLSVKIAMWLVFNNAWWSIEEFVINRHGLWKYMPYYKADDYCGWDLMVAIAVGLAIWSASVRGSSRSMDQLREKRP